MIDIGETNQLPKTHQMSLCNFSLTPMIERLSFAPASKEFTIVPEDFFSYKKFLGVVQWLACQSKHDICQAAAKLSQHSVFPTA